MTPRELNAPPLDEQLTLLAPLDSTLLERLRGRTFVAAILSCDGSTAPQQAEISGVQTACPSCTIHGLRGLAIVQILPDGAGPELSQPETGEMDQLKVKMVNCYGIKSLETDFNFARPTSKKPNVYAVYAPNGAMKSSFAETLKDISEGKKSRDRIFPDRVCERTVQDESGHDLPAGSVVVVSPYDGNCKHAEMTSTLLVDNKLRLEYERLHVEINSAEEVFLAAMKTQSGSKVDVKREISSTFTSDGNSFHLALNRVKGEVEGMVDAPFSDVSYDVLFADQVLSVFDQDAVRKDLREYIARYNELLAKSTYFKYGVFNYYNAGQIAKSLADNGFFNANHTVLLNADETMVISSQAQLEELIAKEKEAITNDKALKTVYAKIGKALEKNTACRDFQQYVGDRPGLMARLNNIKSLKEDTWKSYFKANVGIYLDLLDKIQKAAKRKKEIEDEAKAQRGQWEEVINIFNSRFSVPFTLTAQNKIEVCLGKEGVLKLGFQFKDGRDIASVERDVLLEVLSTGERKAFYILNIIFEVEVRRNGGTETLFVFDDIADSFDYKNKYAIIQYMEEITDVPQFRQIILTHNFDFFRTIQSRFVPYPQCRMAFKSSTGLVFEAAEGIENVFLNDWKKHFFQEPRKKIGSIPFMRNIIEYTKGHSDPEYVKLTSLLHWKTDTPSITEAELDAIYTSLFGMGFGAGSGSTTPVVDILNAEANACLTAGEGINFANKIVLAIAIRLAAEKFMIGKIADPTFVAGIAKNQTQVLVKKFKDTFPKDIKSNGVLHRVGLMTPENIHLNSFMYEPILDMSDEHLRKLYQESIALK